MEHFPFPDHLVQVQRVWLATYRELATLRSNRTTALRRQLLVLSDQVYRHPFWSTPAGRMPAARVELRRAARRQEQRERSAA